ncbi:DUF4339 domain-containing protein [Aeromicrobium fastidiosum]|uniref:DUF4339 domain-containing protein n=1 Tax=Aeromicrobium fastidiosum TaxID=52699 RepID=A0A641ASB6_9ACTN|nr:DUF4339 domain-containing protein [Aeromicrobium fastidiosum]KAA1380427.1 DUF4339 domain-containing protein [Aeromicrobium fastidiosum]MBP2390004.1 hypothetical protein [Aeromicrobium fastidiosum]
MTSRAPRRPVQVAGLTLALLLGAYSGYVHYALVSTDIYELVFRGLASGRTLVLLLLFIAAAWAMSVGALLALVALLNPTVTGRASAAFFVIAACAWVGREITLISLLTGVGLDVSPFTLYRQSTSDGMFAGRWPVIWATSAACLVVGVLVSRTGRPVVATAAPPVPPVASTAGATVPGTHFVHVDGVQYGPFDVDQLRMLVTEGRMLPATLVWPGTGDWRRADEVPGVF